jgi:hypothetical protein
MKSMSGAAATSRRVLMIPADHELDESIDGSIGELSAAINKGKLLRGECALVVLETGTPETARHNERLLRSKLKKASGVFPAVHFMPDALERYITEVCGFDRKLMDMFSRKNGNLGRLTNLCSLIAVSLDARYLHVRIPAVRPPVKETTGRTALETELALFAGCPGEVALTGVELTHCNINPARTMHLPASIPGALSGSSVPAGAPIATRASSGRSTGADPTASTPHKSCYAYKNLFRYFAGPPHRDTPGTENFFALLAASAGIPVRTLAAPHLHLSGGRTPEHLPGIRTPHDTGVSLPQLPVDSIIAETFASSYALMFARYIDFTAVYSLLADFKPLLKLSPTGYIADALHALADKAIGQTDLRRMQLHQFADSIALPGGDRRQSAAAAVRAAIPGILASNFKQVRNHAYLQKQWKKLAGYAACQEILTGVM